MTTTNKKYKKYKESGIDWLGQVPHHWDFSKLRRLCVRLTDGAHISPDLSSEDYPFVSTVNIKDGRIDFANSLKTSSDSYEYLKRNDCKPSDGDVLYSKDGTIGRTCVIDYEKEFVVASSLIIISPKKDEILPVFLDYWLNNPLLFQNVMLKISGAAIKRISIDKIGKIPIYYPSVREQRKIIDFLFPKIEMIDKLLALKKDFVKRLKEKKSAMISHAVTKGLEPKNKQRSSGVDWIGEIPEHWNVKKLKYLCNVCTGDKDTANAEDDGEYPFFVRSQKIEKISSYSMECEAVLTAGDGVGVGKVFHYYDGRFDFHQRVYMFSKFREVTGKFFFYYLRENFKRVALDGGAKSTVDSLRLPLIKNFAFCIPPYKEQDRIVSFLDQATTRVDLLISKVDEAIAMLQEYRASLISSVITGKIRVPGANNE